MQQQRLQTAWSDLRQLCCQQLPLGSHGVHARLQGGRLRPWGAVCTAAALQVADSVIYCSSTLQTNVL